MNRRTLILGAIAAPFAMLRGTFRRKALAAPDHSECLKPLRVTPIGDRQVRVGERTVTRVVLAPCPGCGHTIDLVNASDFHVCNASNKAVNVTVQNTTIDGWERRSFDWSDNA